MEHNVFFWGARKGRRQVKVILFIIGKTTNFKMGAFVTFVLYPLILSLNKLKTKYRFMHVSKTKSLI